MILQNLENLAATVSDVVNKSAKADPMKKMAKEEIESEEEVLEEEEIVSESEEVTEESVDIEEDVNALLGGEELSEEFKEKARVIFESRINLKNQRNPGNPGSSVRSV